MTTAPRIWLIGDLSQAEVRVVAWRGPVPRLKQWFKEGRDVHTLVCQDIAKVVQQAKLSLPSGLFTRKHWSEFGGSDEEREMSKRNVHGNNYGLGPDKLSIFTGLSEEHAKIIQGIYFSLFPEVKTGYQAWIEKEVKTKRCIWCPPPVNFRIVCWAKIDDDAMRSMYSRYAQGTVSALVNQAIARACTIFKEDHDEKLKEIWIAYYSADKWDDWRRLRDSGIRSPQAILWGGMDIRLNIHDAGGISVPNDPDLVSWCARTWKSLCEVPIEITKEDPLVIPVDFKIGPSWGDLKKYIVS